MNKFHLEFDSYNATLARNLKINILKSSTHWRSKKNKKISFLYTYILFEFIQITLKIKIFRKNKNNKIYLKSIYAILLRYIIYAIYYFSYQYQIKRNSNVEIS